MKPSALIAIALAFGAVAAFAIARWAGGSGAGAAGTPVVVATRQIAPGTVLRAAQLTTMSWPKGLSPPGATSDIKELEGRVAREVIHAGEPILPPKLAPDESKGGLAAVIEPGMLAITVRVNEVIAVAGFTLPGSFVDVLASTRDADGQAFSRIVLSRVKVLAVAQDTTGDPTKPKVTKVVTLELTPVQAERLDLARSVGTLSLALRNELDQVESRSPGARLSDLARVQTDPAPTVASPVPAAPVTAPVTAPRTAAPVQQIRGVE